MTRMQVRRGTGYSPPSLLPTELAIRTDNKWLYYGNDSNQPVLLYGQNIVPLERQVLTSNLQLSLTNARRQYIDTNGNDRDVVLPLQVVQGLIFVIRNIGDEIITVKEGANAIGTLGNSTFNNVQSGIEGEFVYDGVNWQITFYG